MQTITTPHQRQMPLRPGQRRLLRSAYSLLELMVAVVLVAGTLVPALALIRDGMEASDEADKRRLLANYAVSKIEEHLAITAATWTKATSEGDFTADGFSELRFVVTTSDLVANGGIDDALMHVHVTTYFDTNGDDALSTGELRCQYRTKIGKFPSYESHAS